MPGSTVSSSADQTKAKVTESPSTNGIFVRPVAVAGIFRPAEESASKPPALPEKRRFSTLSGDLRPCSGGSSDDFARRRQSWDTKAKEVPFGQALLRKTRNSNASSGSSTQELATNGSSHEDISRNDSNSNHAPNDRSSLNSVTEISTPDKTSKTPGSLSAGKEIASSGEGTKLTKVQTNKDEKKIINQVGPNNQNNISNEVASKVGVKNVAGSVVNSTFKISNSEKPVASPGPPPETVDKISNLSDSVKQPKKVYGLIKRDIKSEISAKSEISVSSELKPEIDSATTEKRIVNKESQIDIISKTETSTAVVNTLDSSKSKSKVYGVNKTNIKKEVKSIESVTKQSENDLLSKPTESSIVNKISVNTGINKLPEAKIIGKLVENKTDNKVIETGVVNKQSEVNITANKVVKKSSETGVANIISDIRRRNKLESNTVKETSENKIANKPLETTVVSKVSEIKITNKLGGSNAVNKPSENKDEKKLVETAVPTVPVGVKIVNKLSETVKESDAKAVTKTTVSDSVTKAPPETKSVNKPDSVAKIPPETKSVNKPDSVTKAPPETKSVNKQPEVISVASKEEVVSKSNISKISAGITTAGDKVNEFQKAQSPPKEFRTIRRTSDVIAARIQNIFSNISSPEKPPPLISKKSKTVDKSNASSDTSSIKSTDNNVTDSTIVKNQITVKQPDDTSTTKNVSKVEVKKSSIIGQEVKNDSKCCEETPNKECKYKEQTPSVADRSDLKKENKLAPQSSDVLQSCKVSEVVNVPRVKSEVPLEKADSKTEHSINAAPSKGPDKKNLNIGGKMPIKKPDPKSLDGTASLTATNQDDRKSSDSTPKTVMENTNKGLILKTEFSNTCASTGEKTSKNVSSSNSLNTSLSSAVDFKNTYNVSKNVGNSVHVKEPGVAVKSAVVPSSTDNTSCQQTGTITTASTCVSDVRNVSEVKKTPRKIVSCCIETSESSKIEVAKIAPSTAPSVVPTVNVLFRTKSPQSSATKEENRKKVVVETYASTSPVPSAVINASKVSEKIPTQAPPVCESVQEALNTVESVQKSLNSPRLPTKHSIVNLKKEELATVSLSATDNCTSENTMPPNTIKVDDKCSSVEDSKVGVPVSVEKIASTSVLSETKSVVTVTSESSDSFKKTNSIIFPKSEIGEKFEVKPRYNEKFAMSETNIPSFNSNIDMDRSFSPKMSVLSLDDWSKKFELSEPEPPRVPLRRRALRDSLPPSLPNRSRFGSLKRIDDSPRYIPRSPSQSSLPQRYSYTEMLSKVCSMGVLPSTEPSMSKSCSSSSSQVSELWSELSEEQSTATHTSEILESETTERMRLEKEVQELQNRCSQFQLRSDKMEMEMMEARVYRTPELNGDLSEDEDAEANSSLYKQKYERAVRDMEIMKRRIQQQHEEEIEQKAMLKKASDKRLAEALEDVEEERQVANQWKRKAQKLGSELQDLRLMLEEQMARNGELEKKQRRFDAELSAAQEEIKKERLLREKFSREKEQALHEKYSLEQDLQSSKLDADTLHEKITQLNRELDELTLSSKGEEEVTQLKRAKQELERKSRDQEEELEELAAQVSMLEQAKLRLEMSLEKVRQEHRREASVREEEIEEIRASFSKKIKNLEAQLESEQDERHQLMKQKHELERRLYEIVDQPPPQDPEIERRLRRDLKRTKALLRDAQSMLEHTREGQSGKTLIRQLKNQLEDSEFAKSAAVKARQAVEAELHECQTQLEEATRVKNEVETRCLQLSREKSAIQTQLEEAEEEMAEVMKKYKAVVAQMSIDQKALSEQNQQIADLETEKQMLKDQLSEVSHKFEHLAGQSEDTHKVHRLDGKVRDLESKLELEQTTRSRLEHQIARLKEQNERAREECDSLRNKELQAQEGVRRLQRQMRDLREDYSALQQKEAEAYRKQHELEMALENTETDLQVTKNDLRLACQRIQDLQNALEDDLDSGTDVPDDSGSDSDDSFELSVLRNQSVTPTQRCESAASNYSLASEGFRSRTSSFTHELSAFSSRNDAESKDLNGLSGVNTSSRLLDVEHDEAV